MQARTARKHTIRRRAHHMQRNASLGMRTVAPMKCETKKERGRELRSPRPFFGTAPYPGGDRVGRRCAVCSGLVGDPLRLNASESSPNTLGYCLKPGHGVWNGLV